MPMGVSTQFIHLHQRLAGSRGGQLTRLSPACILFQESLFTLVANNNPVAKCLATPFSRPAIKWVSKESREKRQVQIGLFLKSETGEGSDKGRGDLTKTQRHKVEM